MHPSDANANPGSLDEISISFAALRNSVIDEWAEAVSAVIPAAAELRKPILTNTLPVFYDDIAEALTADYPREIATAGNNLGIAHGRERASSSHFTVADIVHELQIFRKIIFNVTRRENLQLRFSHREIINESIDEAIRQSLTAFSKAHHELEQAVYAGLSHDLRNPLSVANFAARLIEMKSQDTEIVNLAKKVGVKIGEADAMIQSILDNAMLSNNEKLPIDIGQVDIKALAEDACSDIEMAGRTCHVVGTSVIGYWNRESLKRALENLLSNARKFSEPKSIVTVRVSSLDGRMLLAVHNVGKPIPEEDIPRLFKAFERGQESADVIGWGLGLPFVQHVAESHYGTVVVDSAIGRGTTFTISIPLDCRQCSTQDTTQ